MVASNFQASLKRVLVHEGGYSNHPRDPGGVTLEGVIQRVYDADRRRRKLPTKPLTAGMRKTPEWIAERDSIYKRNYWDAVAGDKLPIGVDYCVFDAAVNSGVGQAAKWLQRALAKAGLYKGRVGDNIGIATIDAANQHPDHDALVADICAQRLSMLHGLRTWDAFGVGWARRVAEVKTGGQAWATGANPPKATKIDANEMAKGDERDTKVTETPEGKNGVEQTTQLGAGGILATLLTYYDQVSGLLSSFTGLPPAVSKWIVGIVAAAALAALVWLGIRTIYGLVRLWLDKREVEDGRAIMAETVDTLRPDGMLRPERPRRDRKPAAKARAKRQTASKKKPAAKRKAA